MTLQAIEHSIIRRSDQQNFSAHASTPPHGNQRYKQSEIAGKVAEFWTATLKKEYDGKIRGWIDNGGGGGDDQREYGPSGLVKKIWPDASNGIVERLRKGVSKTREWKDWIEPPLMRGKLPTNYTLPPESDTSYLDESGEDDE
jgi:hypothetical protein